MVVRIDGLPGSGFEMELALIPPFIIEDRPGIDTPDKKDYTYLLTDKRHAAAGTVQQWEGSGSWQTNRRSTDVSS